MLTFSKILVKAGAVLRMPAFLPLFVVEFLQQVRKNFMWHSIFDEEDVYPILFFVSIYKFFAKCQLNHTMLSITLQQAQYSRQSCFLIPPAPSLAAVVVHCPFLSFQHRLLSHLPTIDITAKGETSSDGLSCNSHHHHHHHHCLTRN